MILHFTFPRGDVFYVYNAWSMKANVAQSPVFMDIMQRMDKKLKQIYPVVIPELSSGKTFLNRAVFGSIPGLPCPA